MRSTKLSSAIAAAAALLALAPAGALAARAHPNRRQASPGAGCRVKLNVAPHLLTSGESALAYGQLICGDPTSESTQTVTLYRNATGVAGGYTAIGTTSTDANGFYDLTTGAIETNSQFYVVVGSAKSASKTVRVSAQVTVAGPTENSQILTNLKTGRPNSVKFTGSVSPGDKGATVVLQRQNALTGNEWHRIQLGVVQPNGTFSITHAFVVPGPANIRVLIRGGHRNVPSASNILNYEISQSENPQLTIQSSSDPIAYGGSAAISGTVAGAANTQVTLLAHTAGQHTFAPVAEVKTDGTGNYSFPAQSPLDSTFYRVQGAGKSSTVLYEAVKDVLTAGLTSGSLTATGDALTIQAGQTLTFSGAVTPDHTSHVIYLERENAAGTSFHVVEVAVIGAGSTYTISHTVYTPGTSVFRVKIPGDPQNAGAVSPDFTVTSTPPTSASSLTPEAPGNSSQPAQGQV
jgi:hypothetical protein